MLVSLITKQWQGTFLKWQVWSHFWWIYPMTGNMDKISRWNMCSLPHWLGSQFSNWKQELGSQNLKYSQCANMSQFGKQYTGTMQILINIHSIRQVFSATTKSNLINVFYHWFSWTSMKQRLRGLFTKKNMFNTFSFDKDKLIQSSDVLMCFLLINLFLNP